MAPVLQAAWKPSSIFRWSVRPRAGLRRVKDLARVPQSLPAALHRSWICWVILVVWVFVLFCFLLRAWYESYSKRFHFYYRKQILILYSNPKEFRLLNWSGVLWMLRWALQHMQAGAQAGDGSWLGTGQWGSMRGMSAAFLPPCFVSK